MCQWKVANTVDPIVVREESRCNEIYVQALFRDGRQVAGLDQRWHGKPKVFLGLTLARIPEVSFRELPLSRTPRSSRGASVTKM